MATIRNKSILVIDDDIGMLRALSKVLMSEGCIVAGAANPGAAMEYVTNKTLTIDLVITDLRMPVIDGMRVMECIKRRNPHVPVIVITAFGDPSVRERAAELGAAAFLEKPIDTAHLLDAIQKALAIPT
jgi:DNA-binding NtrC family response regulator